MILHHIIVQDLEFWCKKIYFIIYDILNFEQNKDFIFINALLLYINSIIISRIFEYIIDSIIITPNVKIILYQIIGLFNEKTFIIIIWWNKKRQ